MTEHDHVALPGSTRPPVADATRLRAADPQETVTLTITLAGPPLPDANAVPEVGLTTEEFAEQYGASEEDADRVAAALSPYGLSVVDVSLPTRSMHVSGTVEQIEAAFGTTMDVYQQGIDEFRARSGELRTPAALHGIVTGVFGIDERRVLHRRSTATPDATTTADALTPSDIEHRYRFPAGTGVGQKVAVAEFGGGWFAEDLSAFCTRHSITDPVANVHPVSVGFPVLTLQDIKNLPQKYHEPLIDAAFEVMMDVEIIAALCPDAEVSVYFAPFSEKGWIDLLDAVAKDRPVALSVSWGAPETSSALSRAAMKEIDRRLSVLATLGVTVCVASGDDGSGDALEDGRAHVDYPASSAFVLGVGGTMIDGDDREVTWWQAPGRRAGDGHSGATGGGVSEVWARPSWQDVQVDSANGAGELDGRVVPDVAAVAGPPLYDLTFLGDVAPNGGTSAAAPVWAALLVRVAASMPDGWKQRFLTKLLYAADADGHTGGALACDDVTIGDNTSSPEPGFGYQAGPGYDAVTGWGTPNGESLRTLLSS